MTAAAASQQAVAVAGPVTLPSETVQLAFEAAERHIAFLYRTGVNFPFTERAGTWVYYHPDRGDTTVRYPADVAALNRAVEEGLLGLCYAGSTVEHNGTLTYYTPTAAGRRQMTRWFWHRIFSCDASCRTYDPDGAEGWLR